MSQIDNGTVEPLGLVLSTNCRIHYVLSASLGDVVGEDSVLVAARAVSG